MTEYEITYADVVPKDQQAVTIRKVEEDRHHEVIGWGTKCAGKNREEEAENRAIHPRQIELDPQKRGSYPMC